MQRYEKQCCLGLKLRFILNKIMVALDFVTEKTISFALNFSPVVSFRLLP
jgi:hypothetical protein